MKQTRKDIILAKEKLIIENFKRVSAQLGMTEIEAVASDGGYYDKPEYGTVITKSELLRFKQAAINIFQSLSGAKDDGNFSPENPYEETILKGLKSNGVRLDYDDDEGQEYYWLAVPMSPEELMAEINSVVDNTYDRVIPDKD